MNEKVVLVTGGAGNLGRAVTRAFLGAGARVSVPVYKTDGQHALDPLASEFGERLHLFALDLTTERGAEQAIERVVERGGRLDSVVHLVGGYVGGTRIAEAPDEHWTRMVNLNLTSAYLVARFAIPQVIAAGGGSFVFVSSRAAFEGRARHAAYSATKAGLIAFAKAIAEEYGAEGVRSNVIIPDTIDTEANRLAQPGADFSRWTSPEAIARVILFLASDAARAINGASVPVYGAMM
jgi:NAD(P)-dependent dehydrogenase (short-subunit alcohol dehydrogenase family)